jgi:hypothetical protein
MADTISTVPHAVPPNRECHPEQQTGQPGRFLTRSQVDEGKPRADNTSPQ